MIESKALGSAAGLQYQGVIDQSETLILPSLANGVIIGRFKRGRTDKPFTVTASNYQALLGHDPSSPSFVAVDDAFRSGLNQLTVMRLGKSMLATIPQVEPPKPDNELSSIAINGVLRVGEILTAVTTDTNGIPNDIVYQWFANSVAISSATAETYVLKVAEVGKTITVTASFNDNDGFTELATSAATEAVQHIESVDDGIAIKDFDFAVVKYRWTDIDGSDLDTRTWISSPNRSENKVGWSRLANDSKYLSWNQDNRGSGVESVLIDMKSIQQDFPAQKDVVIKMAAFWYSSVLLGNVQLQLTLFKGGEMIADSDYDWINNGGRVVQKINLLTNTKLLTSEDVNGELLATLKINADTGNGVLTNPDGAIGVENPVLPEVLPVGAPLKFSTENRSGTGELPIKLQLINPIGDWFLTAKGLPVASFDGALADGVTVTSNEDGLTLELKNTYKDIMNYELLGQFDSISLFSGAEDADGLVEVTQFGEKIERHYLSLKDLDLTVPDQLPTSITTTQKMFSGSTYFNQDLPNWDTSNVTDMSYMFEDCLVFEGNISNWDVTNVTNMQGMFKGSEAFNIDISSWNVSKVTDMSYMFKSTYDFNKPIGVWDVSGVVDMSHMFEGTGYFNEDITPWDVSNVTNMENMFNLADEFNQDLSQWCVLGVLSAPLNFDTAPYWTNAKPVWGTCPKEAPVVEEPAGEVFTFSAFNDYDDRAPLVVQLQNALGFWAIKEDGVVVATSDGYINNKFTLTSDSLSSYVTIYVIGEDAKAYEVIGKMDTVRLFHNYKLINSEISVKILSFGERVNSHEFDLHYSDLTVPNVLPNHVKSTQYMFRNCDMFNQDISGWNMSNVTNMKGMFKDCEIFNQSVSSWNTVNVIDMSYMFDGCYSYTQDISSLNVSNVTDMSYMFRGCEALTSSLGGWDVTKVINMSYMFAGCLTFNGFIAGWNTINVTNMSHMFDGCEVFNQAIRNWNVSSVVDMSYMFNMCEVYNKPMIDWDVSNVVNMQNMFTECYMLNKPLSTWNVSNVVNMSSMFEWCDLFNQDLSAWTPSKIKTKPTNFDKNASSWIKPQPSWGGV